MQHREISTFHIVFFFMMGTGLLNHVIIIPPLLDTARRDAWLSVILSFFVFLIWALVIFYLVRATSQQNLHVWLETAIGKPVAYVFSGTIILYLLVIAATTLKDLTMWTYVTYLPRTPQVIIMGTFLLLCLSLAHTSIRTIAIVNGILLPIVLFLGFFAATSNLPKKDYTLLTPLFEFGYMPVLQGMIYACAGLFEIIVILFLQHHVKTKINYWSLVIIGLILTWLTLGPTTGAIATFGPTKASELRFPAFEQWALVSLSRYLEHLDFLSVYQWLSGAFIRISLALFIISDLLQLADKKRRWLLWAAGLCILGVNLIPINDMQFIYMLARYILPGSLLYTISLAVLLSLLVTVFKRRGYHHDI